MGRSIYFLIIGAINIIAGMIANNNDNVQISSSEYTNGEGEDGLLAPENQDYL